MHHRIPLNDPLERAEIELLPEAAAAPRMPARARPRKLAHPAVDVPPHG